MENFLVVDLGSIDVVPGMQWLSTLGSMEVDWGRLTMIFRRGSKIVVLKGDLSITKREVC